MSSVINSAYIKTQANGMSWTYGSESCSLGRTGSYELQNHPVESSLISSGQQEWGSQLTPRISVLAALQRPCLLQWECVPWPHTLLTGRWPPGPGQRWSGRTTCPAPGSGRRCLQLLKHDRGTALTLDEWEPKRLSLQGPEEAEAWGVGIALWWHGISGPRMEPKPKEAEAETHGGPEAFALCRC